MVSLMPPDSELRAYLKEIYEAEGPKLYGYLVKKAGVDLAQDIMQESFARLMARLKNSAQIANARAYLFQIARHLLYHESAFSRRFTVSEAMLENRAAVSANEGSSDLETNELMTTLTQAVHELTSKEKEIFEMRWNLGFSQLEIAAALKKSERQIRRDLEKIVAKLRAFFKSHGWPDAGGIL